MRRFTFNRITFIVGNVSKTVATKSIVADKNHMFHKKGHHDLSFGNIWGKVEVLDFFRIIKKNQKEEANYNVGRGMLEEMY